MAYKKFMQAIDQGQYKILKAEASKRGINIQELIRGIVIPEWLQKPREQ